MKLADLIEREMVIPSLVGTNKTGIIRELAAHLAEKAVVEEERVAKVLLDREGLASTAIGDGVAIPHGKLGGVERIIAGIGRARDGVDFDAMDGEPTYLFFVMIAPDTSTGAHLKALARISRVFKDRVFRQRLLEAPDADGMYEVLIGEDEKN